MKSRLHQTLRKSAEHGYFGKLRQADRLSPGVWDQPDQNGKTPSLPKSQVSQAWWHAPIIPATWEAEAGESPEPRRWRLQWAKTAPLHSSLGNKSETPSQKIYIYLHIIICNPMTYNSYTTIYNFTFSLEHYFLKREENSWWASNAGQYSR